MTQALANDVIYLSDQLCRMRELTPQETDIVIRAIGRQQKNRWCAHDDNQLRLLAQQGKPASRIAATLDRSMWAVFKRAKRLGISMSAERRSVRMVR